MMMMTASRWEQVLASVRAAGPRAQVLDMYPQRLTETRAAGLAAALAEGGGVAHLFACLAAGPWVPAALARLAAALGAQGRTLSVGGGSVDDAAVAALAAALAGNTTLVTLQLDVNSVGDEGAQALAELLAAPRCGLRTLHLNGNRIGAAGAAALAGALRRNTTLQHLSLGGNNIGVAGATVLADALQGNRTLVSLSMEGNKDIPAAAVAAVYKRIHANAVGQLF